MKSVIDQFSKRAGTYSGSANWISSPELMRAHLDAATGSPKGHLLEICCGTGMVGRNFQAAGWHVCGVDLTRHMAEEANRFFPCICTPAEQIPFLDNSFDVVLLRQAYFLLDEGQKVLAEACRVLKAGGIFILSQTVPYSEVDHPWLEHIHRTKQLQMREFYSEPTLARELEQQYFRIETVNRLSVRENINDWMAAAPELSAELQAKVIDLVANAPAQYRQLHDVQVADAQVTENWNWVIFTARKK